MKQRNLNNIRFDVGVDQALAEKVVGVLAKLGYRTGSVLTAIHQYQINGTPTTIIAKNNASSDEPESLEYSDTAFYNNKDLSGIETDYALLPRLGFRKPTQAIPISDKYTVVISPDKQFVQVGCQTIPRSKIEEVWKALQ